MIVTIKITKNYKSRLKCQIRITIKVEFIFTLPSLLEGIYKHVLYHQEESVDEKIGDVRANKLYKLLSNCYKTSLAREIIELVQFQTMINQDHQVKDRNARRSSSVDCSIVKLCPKMSTQFLIKYLMVATVSRLPKCARTDQIIVSIRRHGAVDYSA